MLSIFRRIFGRGNHEPGVSSESPKDQQVEFSIGDRVRDPWGNEGTITVIDPTAEHGMGVIKVQFPDGSETSVALVASGLEKVGDG